VKAFPRERCSEAEYLERERRSEIRHEYLDGEVSAMAGGSPRHNLIAGNIIGALWSRLRGTGCAPIPSDQRVHVPSTRLYTYPDVTVVCGAPEVHADDRSSIVNPRVIFEVLSRATEAYDRGVKFSRFQRVPSLAEYVLVEQSERRIEHYRRMEGRQWLLTVVEEGELELPALACTLLVDDVYASADAYPDDSAVG
jgi:Uma2 family endonuclease